MNDRHVVVLYQSLREVCCSNTGLNRYLCSPFQISITYVCAILSVRARLLSTRGRSLILAPRRIMILNILLDSRDTHPRPCDNRVGRGMPFAALQRDLAKLSVLLGRSANCGESSRRRVGQLGWDGLCTDTRPLACADISSCALAVVCVAGSGSFPLQERSI